MLKELRTGAAGFFAKALLGLLVLSFVLWGVGDIIRQGSPKTIARVGDEDIALADFEQEIMILRRTFGESMPTSGVNLINLYRMALNEMIARTLLRKEAQRLGLSISNDTLAQEIGRNENFRNSSGEFDKVIFQQTLRQNSMSESEYLDTLRASLQQQLLLGIVNGENLTPSGYSTMIYGIENELRTIDLLAIDALKDYVAAEPTEDDIRAFYDQHMATFTAPEYRSLEVIRLQPSAIMKSIEVSREEVFDLYNSRSDSLMIPEKREVLQLLYSTKAEAENAYSMLRSGSKFDEVATTLPPINKDAISLGMVTKEQLPPEAGNIFALSNKEFSQPTESAFGWHVYYIKSIQEKRATPFDDVKKSLEDEVRQQKGEQKMQGSVEMLEDALAGTDSLKDAAKQAEAPFEVIDGINRQGLASDNREVLSPVSDEALLATAFSLSDGERSELVRQPDGGYYAVRVTGITPPRQRTLDEVRGQVAEAWKEEKLQQARKNYASDIVKALSVAKSAEDAKSILKNYQVEKTPLVPVRRNGSVIGIEGVSLPPPLVEDIFSLREPFRPTSAYRFTESGYVIAFLQKIEPAPATEKNEAANQQLQTVRRALRKDYENEVMDQYINHLRSRYPVTVNEALLSSLVEREE